MVLNFHLSDQFWRGMVAGALLILCAFSAAGLAQDRPSPEAIVEPWLSRIPEVPFELDDEFPQSEDLNHDLGDADWHWLEREADSAARYAALLHLLLPREGQYASLTALKSLVDQFNPVRKFGTSEIVSLNEKMLAYTAFHRQSKVLPANAIRLRAHLEGFSREVHQAILEGGLPSLSGLAPEFNRNRKSESLAITRFWRKADSPAFLGYQDKRGERASDRDLLTWTDSISGGREQGLWELDLQSGQIRTEKIPGFDHDDVTRFIAQQGRRFVSSGHDGFAQQAPGDTWRRFELPAPTLYLNILPWQAGVLCLWTAPPHYFGGLELERDPVRAAALLKSLEPAFYFWNGRDSEVAPVPKSKSMGFLDNAEIELSPTLVTEDGRLLLGVRRRIPEDPAVPSKVVMHVSTPGNAENYNPWANVPTYWQFRTWPGGPPDEVLVLINRPGGFTSRWDGEPQPESVLSCNLTTRRARLLWALEPEKAIRHPWTVQEIKEPKVARWKLPDDYDPPPPGTVHEWLRTFGQGDRLYALCSRVEVGKQTIPDYELLVFKPGQEVAQRVALKFVLPNAVKEDLLRAQMAKQSPSREEELDPLPLPTESFLVFDTRYGVFWVSWKEIEAWMGK